MSFSVTEIADGKTIEATLTGKLGKEACEQFLSLAAAVRTTAQSSGQ